jgi:hypothetical protein
MRTIAESLTTIEERQRLVLLGAMKQGAQLHAGDNRASVVAWHLTVASLLEHAGAQRRGEARAVALDGVGMLTEAAAGLTGQEIDAVAVGLLLALEHAPSPTVADFLYGQVLILDEESARRRPPSAATANDGLSRRL